MISYKLAKELKDAGFKQKHAGYCEHNEYMNKRPLNVGGSEIQTILAHIQHLKCATAYAPTLEELIEACGDELYQLSHVKVLADDEKLGWKASSSSGKSSGYGETPSEAVANFYLLIKKGIHWSGKDSVYCGFCGELECMCLTIKEKKDA